MSTIRVEYAILGAGALGSILGAHLTQAGHDVVLLARGRRAGQVSADGLKIQGLVRLSVPIPVITDPGQLMSAGTLIVATKAIGTAQALRTLEHAKIGAALSLQNGMQKDEFLGASFGPGTVLGAVANFSGELLDSGAVEFTRNVNLRIGEPGGVVTARVQGIVDAIDAAGVKATTSATILADEWSKFAAWAGLMVLSVTTRRPTGDFLCDPDAALLLVRVVREVGQLAAACNVELAGAPVFPVRELCTETEQRAVELVTAVGRSFQSVAPTHRVSALQDLEAGRPLEIEETIGHAVAMAARLQLQLPLLQNYYRVLAGFGRPSG